jgi:hydrogenase/urease accessory protein HupE
MASVRFAAFAAALVSFLFSSFARGHEVGLSRGEYWLAEAVLTADLTFSRREIAALVADLDANHDGEVSQPEIDRGRSALARAIVDRIEVRGDGARCASTLQDVRLIQEDGLTVEAEYRCKAAPRRVQIEWPLMEDLSQGHRHLARARAGGQPMETAIFRGQPSLEIAAQPGSMRPEADSGGPGTIALFLMGIEHILTGYDHLVFLLGLVLVGGRWRSLLLVITAFTVAHSITLGMAALGVWAPSARIVEPAIALSIAYVGIENFFVKDADKRWRITFPFGLVHGFGFAGALVEIALSRAEIPRALFAFNLGVEAGQLAVLAVVLPVIVVARKKPWFEQTGVKVLSAAIAAAGVLWFVLRVAGS